MGLFPLGGGFTIDGISSDVWCMYYQSWTISIMPSLRANLVSIPGRTGRKSTGTEIDSRIVQMVMSCSNQSRQALHANLKAFARAIDPRSGSHKLCLVDDDPNFYINVVPNTDVQATVNMIKADFTIQWEAADPHWYWITSRSYPWAANNATPLVVANSNGNDSTPVKIHIVGPASGTATGIIITFGGSTFTYNGSLISTDYLDIDTDAYTVTKNGINDIGNWGGDDFPFLAVGASLTMTWHDTNNAGATVTVSYNERSI